MKREIEQTGHRHHYLATRNRFCLVERTLITLNIRAGVDPLAEDGEELDKESFVHVPGHLVEDKPVADAAVKDVVLDVIGAVGALEITTSLHFNEKEPRKKC